ncbi:MULTISPECIES: DUF6127 family protein [unclassified Sphingopyxis]|uniref:DUF6127 family protein n=1 Tax=unclassified Sphingopyxis TaxID=2614943 RepID=UPI0007374B29|nr:MULTISPECIES: DUF6127 family protein [unclassified Sphingopyxis]KTE28757.1 hypothetical protein ATE62_21435 [Sphingopyxis sp. HIX]KTE74068.1 hypothetical protein ATE72_21725 [Sphingopyxis sp. HXXIV]
MDEEEALARLVALAGAGAPEGFGVDAAILRALIEEASEMGARRALARLGLADEAARGDVSDLRQLLGAWRDAKTSAWKAAIDWAVRGVLALVVVGLAVKMGLPGLLR